MHFLENWIATERNVNSYNSDWFHFSEGWMFAEMYMNFTKKCVLFWTIKETTCCTEENHMMHGFRIWFLPKSKNNKNCFLQDTISNKTICVFTICGKMLLLILISLHKLVFWVFFAPESLHHVVFFHAASGSFTPQTSTRFCDKRPSWMNVQIISAHKLVRKAFRKKYAKRRSGEFRSQPVLYN